MVGEMKRFLQDTAPWLAILLLFFAYAVQLLLAYGHQPMGKVVVIAERWLSHGPLPH